MALPATIIKCLLAKKQSRATNDRGISWFGGTLSTWHHEKRKNGTWWSTSSMPISSLTRLQFVFDLCQIANPGQAARMQFASTANVFKSNQGTRWMSPVGHGVPSVVSMIFSVLAVADCGRGAEPPEAAAELRISFFSASWTVLAVAHLAPSQGPTHASHDNMAKTGPTGSCCGCA